MQTAKLYSVYDIKAAAFMTPFFSTNHNTALRSFEHAVTDPNSPVYNNPEDFNLYYVGDWDAETGDLAGCNPEMLAQAAITKQHLEAHNSALNAERALQQAAS